MRWRQTSRPFLLFLACVCSVALFATGTTTVAWFQQTPEGTFQIDNQFITGLRSPTGMTFAPDGRLFVTEQAGVVRVIAPGGQLLSTPFLTLSNIASAGERGLLGLAFDPDFTSNGYVYIFYTPNSPALSRLSRVTANGDVAVASSLVTLLEWPNSYSNHRGGDIHFGPDGKLYLAVGDAGAPTNAQTVTLYNGKVLRLNKDGSVPSDNPTSFTDTSGATLNPSGPYRAIWAIGLRNPYRFAFDGATGAMRINDVGGSLEETNVGRAGRNYGWPTCQGGACSNAYAENPAYAYTHSNGCAITGGAFYQGTQFPAGYQGNYFTSDYCATSIRYVRTDNSAATLPVSIPAGAVDLNVAPDGSIYILGYEAGIISRITFAGTGSNRNPVAQMAASPTSGAAPLTVSFSASGSSDPDGDPLTYAWEFGDGATGAGLTSSHVYANSGTYTARLTVSDGRGGSHLRQLTITVGNPPDPIITAPVQGSLYSAGETISFSGTATDLQDGTLPASAFSWRVLFHHDSHTHPAFGPINGVTSGSFTVPTTGHPEHTVFYRIYLTVTDSSGLQREVTRDVMPRKVNITLTTNVSGAQVLLDGAPMATPLTFTSVVGVQRTIAVVSPQTIGGQAYEFTSWSDGGANSHTIAVPATNTTYTATLTPSAAAPRSPGNVRIVR